MDIHHKIRNNIDHLQHFMKDVNLWESDMKRKESTLFENNISDNKEELPPIRNKISKMDVSESCPLNVSRPAPAVLQNMKKQEALYEKERGNFLVKQKKWSEAVFRYTQAIEIFPEEATFYTNRALCFLRMKKWREAETDCTTAIQLNPSYDKGYFRRGLALKELYQYREARDDFIEAMNLDPDNARAQNEIVELDRIIINENTTTQSSVSHKSEVTMDKRQLAYTKKKKGNLFVKKQNWKAAIECYTEACSLYPEDGSFYLNRALCFLKTDEPHKTILDCIRVLELDPDNVKAYYRRAMAYRSLGEKCKAHDDLLTAFQLNPSNQAILNDLNDLEKILNIFPQEKNDEIRQLLKEDIRTRSELIENSTRISGDRFLNLGGKLIKPRKKPVHALSKKPMKNVIISRKNRKESILACALEELKRGSLDAASDVTVSSKLQEKMSVSSKFTIEDLEKLIDEVSVPRNNLQFMLTWNKLPNSQLQYKFLQKVQAINLPEIFKEALECHIFSEILQVLATQCVESGDKVYEYLLYLSRVKRFGALFLFATEEDKRNIELMLNYCERNNDVCRSDVEELKRNYYY